MYSRANHCTANTWNACTAKNEVQHMTLSQNRSLYRVLYKKHYLEIRGMVVEIFQSRYAWPCPKIEVLFVYPAVHTTQPRTHGMRV